MRHILANYYVKDHFQASQLETLVWSDPANLAGEMIKNQNVLIFVPNKSKCIDICPFLTGTVLVPSQRYGPDTV